VTFESPSGLWLLALVPVLWLLASRSRATASSRRLMVATLLRCAAVALVALALAAPVWLERSREISAVYAIDISRSVSPAFLPQALDWIAGANTRYTPAQVRFVVFGDRARLVKSQQDVLAVPVADQDAAGEAEAIDQSVTDLEQALSTAVFGFAPGTAPRLVLVTDGNQTQGDLWRALPQLQAQGIRIFTIPAPVAVDNDAWVDSIALPSSVREQEPIAVEVHVFSRTATAASLRVADADRVLATRALQLHPGDNEVSLTIRLPRQGSRMLTAQVQAVGDQDARNDTASQSVWVGPRPRVLYVESAPESAHYLADALRAHHIDVTVATPEALRAEHGLLAGQDAIVLSDVEARSVDAPTAGAIERFVRDRGQGLIFAAGERTYGRQGYSGSRVERLLPVRFQGKRKRRDLDLVLLLDRSHSMRGRKLELAKSAALATLDLLEKHHRLAVVAFDSRPRDVVPLAEVGGKRRAEDLIAGMTSSGQTNIYHALAHAQRLLASSGAPTRHILLLSDGVTAPPPGTAVARSRSEEAQELVRQARAETMRQVGVTLEPEPTPEPPVPHAGGMEGLVAELAADKITLSTIAIGDKPNLELMRGLAAWGNGRNYVAASDAEIPSLFVAETRRLLGESIVEQPFQPEVSGRAESIAGVDFAAGPPLGGFVVARSKPFSEVLLQAPQDQPLLAQTHYGLGKSVAFLSDVKNRWSAQWLTWEGYGRFWAQVVRDTIPPAGGESLSWGVRREGRDAVVELRALAEDRTHRNGLVPKVRVTAPDGNTSVLGLRQIAPGRYRASAAIEPGRSAPYRFELLEGGGLPARDVAQAGARGLTYPWPDEYRVLPPNTRLLQALSERTGGVFEPEPEDIFADRGDGAVVARPLWPWLAAAALVLFLLDVLVRRAPWPLPALSARAHDRI
jgi:Ca-activated chloride channel family protein